MTNNTIALVIPCYNEASRGLNTEKSLSNRLKILYETLDKEIVPFVVFVNDGSKDDTRDVINIFISKNELKGKWHLLENEINKGKGKSVLEGLKYATSLAPYIAYMDADLSVPLNTLNEVLKDCNENTIICGQRTYTTKQSMPRKILSKLTKICNKLIVGIKVEDTQCPLKVIPSVAFLKVHDKLVGYRWIFDIELLWELQKEKYVLKKYPVLFDNMQSLSLSTTKATWQSLKDLCKFKMKRILRR